ncbi:PmoA family protein [Roseiconus lacunae]|uniref:PmoA family protein n=1 Tax=Roseiconus lacunae TaxID=2605694 RepID=A0ABT7PR83_9BACT|nr:PmoA family protein [Roseiconus lacunae]MDM4018616.1 PmoA family protein [Roseiconus lacunae]
MNRILAWAFALLPVAVFAGDVKIVDDGNKAVVTIDGQPFTEYRYTGYAKPILYPVIGPGDKPMTRNYPMVKEVENEASDHPHHKSIWYTHDEVNGVRFWMESPEGQTIKNVGKQVSTSLKIDGDSIMTTSDWRSADGESVCTDERVIRFGTVGDARFIDYEVTWIASSGDLLIGDTKEGTMGIRTHPNLRLKASPKHGNHTVSGQSVNSEGVRGAAMWGKRAAWVDYWGEIDGDTVGVAIFDHPGNPRHPTWWHARDYGLVAANPFGIHDFEKKADGTGDMTLKSGEKMTFKYRFVFHPGDVESAKISERYQEYAK